MPNFTSNHSRTSRAVLLEPLDTWYWVIRGIIAILAITGNGLVIYLIVFKRRLRVTNNWFVLSLAVADFCIGLFTTTSGIACTLYFRCDWSLQIVFYNFLLFSSTWNLWAMAIDRYIGIVYSLRYSSVMTTRRVIAMVATSWSISFVAAFVRLLWWHNNQFTQTIDKRYRVIIDLLFGAASCVVLIFIYFRVFYITRKLAKQIATQKNDINYNYRPNDFKFQRPTRRNLSTRFLGSVVSLFVVCNSLSIYISFCSTFRLCSVNPLIKIVAYLLVHFNSAINFIVYAFMKQDIRLELKRLCRCGNSVEPCV